jgi:hypothetical protein
METIRRTLIPRSEASVGLHYYRYRVSRRARFKDMLTVLLQLYQTRVAGLILPVFLCSITIKLILYYLESNLF